MEHGEHCPRPLRGRCLRFSTDGTRMGADIAHMFGTTDEEEIKNNREESIGTMAYHQKHSMTGMDPEQAEWESEDASAWG